MEIDCSEVKTKGRLAELPVSDGSGCPGRDGSPPGADRGPAWRSQPGTKTANRSDGSLVDGTKDVVDEGFNDGVSGGILVVDGRHKWRCYPSHGDRAGVGRPWRAVGGEGGGQPGGGDGRRGARWLGGGLSAAGGSGNPLSSLLSGLLGPRLHANEALSEIGEYLAFSSSF